MAEFPGSHVEDSRSLEVILLLGFVLMNSKELVEREVVDREVLGELYNELLRFGPLAKAKDLTDSHK